MYFNECVIHTKLHAQYIHAPRATHIPNAHLGERPPQCPTDHTTQGIFKTLWGLPKSIPQDTDCEDLMPGGEKGTTTCTKVRQKRRGKHFNTPRTPQATELIATTTILTVDDMCNVTYTEHGDQDEAGNYRSGTCPEPVDYLSSCGLVSASFHKTSIRIVRGGSQAVSGLRSEPRPEGSLATAPDAMHHS